MLVENKGVASVKCGVEIVGDEINWRLGDWIERGLLY